MGGNCCKELPIKPDHLKKLSDRYMLLGKEVLQLYKKWVSIGGSLYEKDTMHVVSDVIIKECKQLEHHPWAKRICFVFASHRDPSTGLSVLNFENFLAIASVFHFRTPVEIKYYWAFKLYDFDNDKIMCL